MIVLWQRRQIAVLEKADRNDAVARGDKAYKTYQKSDPKDEKLFEQQTRILQEGDDAFRRCFAQRAAAEPFFPALTKQAQELVDKVK
ncbi:MAG TPA: hypothetical protein VK438_06815 [Xanthobacteraceae bacterium]|nr:hypothetical protein [Xanthobacteraceae bacterium]